MVKKYLMITAMALVASAASSAPNDYTIAPAQCLDEDIFIRDTARINGQLVLQLAAPNPQVIFEIWIAEDQSWIHVYRHPNGGVLCVLGYGMGYILTPPEENPPEGDPT